MKEYTDPLTGEKVIATDRPSKTQLDRMREAISLAIAKRMHKHIKPHPYAIDDDDIIVEREGWITVEEIMAVVYINSREIGAEPYECFSEAAKRNVI